MKCSVKAASPHNNASMYKHYKDNNIFNHLGCSCLKSAFFLSPEGNWTMYMWVQNGGFGTRLHDELDNTEREDKFWCGVFPDKWIALLWE